MQYGYFDDEAKEYVVTRPDTPTSWSNYLGSTEYGAVITNNAGGYGFYKSGAQGRFMRLRFNSIPMDQPGRYFYLRAKRTVHFLRKMGRSSLLHVCVLMMALSSSRICPPPLSGPLPDNS